MTSPVRITTPSARALAPDPLLLGQDIFPDVVGRDAPLRRSRRVSALAPGEALGGTVVAREVAVAFLSAPDGSRLGRERVIVNRLVAAGRVADTRAL